MKLFTFLFMSVLSLLVGCAMPGNMEKVIVTVNGVPIREKQVTGECDRRLRVIAAHQEKKGLTFDKKDRKGARLALRDDALHTLIEKQLIADQLKADGIEFTDADVEAYFLDRVKERGKTLKEAEEELKEQGKTLEEAKEQVRWQGLGVEALYQVHAENKREMTEADARKIYDEDLASYALPEERRVSQILIISGPDFSESYREAARAKAEKILKKVRAGEDFDKLVKTYSEDTFTKNRSGDKGWSPRGFVTDPNNDPFGEITFAMKNIGDISDIIEDVEGYHIAKLTGIKEARIKSFKEAKWEIMWDFKKREIRDFWDEFGQKLWGKAKIEWDPGEKDRRDKEQQRQREYVEQFLREAKKREQAEQEEENCPQDEHP